MKLIVGLGNPSKEYENTRHNIGFKMLDYYLKYKKVSDKWLKKFDGMYLQTMIREEKVIFLKPQTFMNLSGISVKKTMDFFKIDLNDVLIISDDLDLSVGNFKLKEKGSCGGHNGLKNIEENIKSSNYHRLKIGISNNKEKNTKDYVLGNLSKNEKEEIEQVFKVLCNVLDDYFDTSFADLMNKYNRKNR